ncbi:neuronal acetylcholine receptor subunit alpha-10-like isoform X2 [Ornithodoros turicata]|uniref:neuronal acetylcholine receptor subunit alpha-10-like isoform X2 n=1 Tax=Ornithodoros turicata TaxID=34597 RepID=UPI00313A02FC
MGCLDAFYFLCFSVGLSCVSGGVASNDTPRTLPSKEEERLIWNDEKRLLETLMRGYDNSVRPVKNSSDPVIIRLGITLTQIFDLDEKNQVLTTNVWLDQEWSDEYLVWDPVEFGNLTKLRIPCDKIWLPDIVLYNNADDYTRGYYQSRAMLDPTGNVFWPPPTKFRSTCPVDVTYFPFDDQSCVMKLGSWIYDGLQVDVQNRTKAVDLTNYVPNGEWELLEARLVRNVVFYPCCPEPFPDVTVTLVIRRKTLYYMYNVVMPCMMMSVLTLLVFCLPPDSGEKIALGVTVLLAFSVFMLAIAEKMPETSESIPLLVVMTVIVLNFHYRGPSRKEVPHWLRRLVLHGMARTCCSRNAQSSSNAVPTTTYTTESDHHHHPLESLHLTIGDDKMELAEFSSNDSIGNSNEMGRNSGVPRRRHCKKRTPSNRKIQDEVLRTLQYLLEKQEREDHVLRTVNEWRQMALIIDRFLFWVFLVVTVASSLSFLVIIPVQRRGLQL